MSSPGPAVGGGALGAAAAQAAAAAAAGGSGSGGLVAADAGPSGRPSSAFTCPLLTDMYQVTMAYAYWRAGKAEQPAVFDMFFRRAPFGGEFAVFAGLEEVLRLLQCWRLAPEHVAYLRGLLPGLAPDFWPWLAALDASAVRVHACAEGTVVFPREPLLRVEGPLAICQLLETTLLNLCNFATLICTNAARHRLAAGPGKTLLEFGLRRAQGPDGAMSASRYAAVGGFDGTSNLLAGMAFGLAPRGTHAHALVSAFVGLDELRDRQLGTGAAAVDGVALALQFRAELGYGGASLGELAAFLSFAQAFPDGFVALVDTYDVLGSGLPNFICVALALARAGHTALGIRLDSGDLAYLSRAARAELARVDARYGTRLAACSICASNDINEAVLHSLNKQGHEIDVFAIGTNLVTCQAQPALGMVYKLVEIRGVPRIKLSQEASKVTLPCKKEVYRLIGVEGVPILDLILRAGEPRPMPGKRVLARHPFDEKKRAYVTPTAIIPLLRLVWLGARAAADDREPAAAAAAALRAAADSPAADAEADGSASPQLRRLLAAHTPPSAALVGAAESFASGPAADAPAAVAAADAPEAAAAAAASGSMRARFPPLADLRAFVGAQLTLFRGDHLRPLNPTPYKISVSTELYHFTHELLMKEVPIAELE